MADNSILPSGQSTSDYDSDKENVPQSQTSSSDNSAEDYGTPTTASVPVQHISAIEEALGSSSSCDTGSNKENDPPFEFDPANEGTFLIAEDRPIEGASASRENSPGDEESDKENRPPPAYAPAMDATESSEGESSENDTPADVETAGMILIPREGYARAFHFGSFHGFNIQELMQDSATPTEHLPSFADIAIPPCVTVVYAADYFTNGLALVALLWQQETQSAGNARFRWAGAMSVRTAREWGLPISAEDAGMMLRPSEVVEGRNGVQGWRFWQNIFMMYFRMRNE
jgi:hypothetical protein